MLSFFTTIFGFISLISFGAVAAFFANKQPMYGLIAFFIGIVSLIFSIIFSKLQNLSERATDFEKQIETLKKKDS